MSFSLVLACIALGWSLYALYKTIQLHRENERLRAELRERMARLLDEGTETHDPTYPRVGTISASRICTGPLTVGTVFANGESFTMAAERVRVANARSRELLIRFLTPEQRAEFAKPRSGGMVMVESFTATAPSGNKYEIRWGGIDRLDDKGERICSYCYEPAEPGLPVYDQMLARKLMVEHHEEQVLRDGNLVYHRDGISRPTAELRTAEEA